MRVLFLHLLIIELVSPYVAATEQQIPEVESVLIGHIQYRCGDGGLTERFPVIAPRRLVLELCISKQPEESALREFLLQSGNSFSSPSRPLRPFRSGQRACRSRLGIAYSPHTIQVEMLRSFLKQNCRILEED